jgi:hypothetical protein
MRSGARVQRGEQLCEILITESRVGEAAGTRRFRVEIGV